MIQENTLLEKAVDLVMEHIQAIGLEYLDYFNTVLRSEVYQEVEEWLVPTSSVKDKVLMELYVQLWQDLDAIDLVRSRGPVMTIEHRTPTDKAMVHIKEAIDRSNRTFYDKLRDDVADDVEAWNLPTEELTDKALLALYEDLEDYMYEKELLCSHSTPSEQEERPLSDYIEDK